jgi:hypothetical protein
MKFLFLANQRVSLPPQLILRSIKIKSITKDIQKQQYPYFLVILRSGLPKEENNTPIFM